MKFKGKKINVKINSGVFTEKQNVLEEKDKKTLNVSNVKTKEKLNGEDDLII